MACSMWRWPRRCGCTTCAAGLPMSACRWPALRRGGWRRRPTAGSGCSSATATGWPACRAGHAASRRPSPTTTTAASSGRRPRTAARRRSACWPPVGRAANGYWAWPPAPMAPWPCWAGATARARRCCAAGRTCKPASRRRCAWQAPLTPMRWPGWRLTGWRCGCRACAMRRPSTCRPRRPAPCCRWARSTRCPPTRWQRRSATGSPSRRWCRPAPAAACRCTRCRSTTWRGVAKRPMRRWRRRAGRAQ